MSDYVWPERKSAPSSSSGAVGGSSLGEALNERAQVREQVELEAMMNARSGTIVQQEKNYAVRDDLTGVTFLYRVRDYGWLRPELVGMPVQYTLAKGRFGTEATSGKPEAALKRLAELRGPEYGGLAKGVSSADESAALAASGHLAEASASEPLRSFMIEVQSGMFTSKRSESGAINTSDLPGLIGNVGTFYKFADVLRQKYQDPLAAKGHTLKVYRAIRTSSLADESVDILPSSTSFSLDFVKSWAGSKENGRLNYVILEILLPITHPMLMLAYPGSYTGPRYPPPLNQDQEEVTIAPAKYQKSGERTDDGFRIVQVTAQALTPEQSMGSLEETS